MKIILHQGKPAPKEAILALEAFIGHDISAAFREFLEANDGAKPESNIFKISVDNDSGVNKFIPVSQIPQELELIGNLPPRTYPIAWAEGGNYVVIDEDREGKVFFWDHETRGSLIMLANNLGEFLMLLHPFDARSIPLRPDQVKRVWVDPEFLKKLKKS